jgi:molybdate transport system substrate-binding protein
MGKTSRAFAFVLGATVLWSGIALADDIRVLTGNAVQAPQRALAEQFTAKTGHTVTFTSTNPRVMQQKLDSGEPFELLVIPSAFLKAYGEHGKLLAGSYRPLAKVGVGIAAREGAKYDFSSPDAFKKMLLDAKAITYSDASTGGLSALSVQKVLQNLGLADAMKAKAITRSDGQEMIARGEVDFGLYNVSEIPRAKGVVLAGRVPAAVQAYLDYDAGIPKASASPAPAQAFLAFMASRDAKLAWDKVGIDQAGN